MTRRRRPCDVPGCPHERASWQRLCTSCFPALPARIRDRILKGWKFDRAVWRAARREAQRHLRGPEPQQAASAKAYALTARITGERDEIAEAAE